MGRGRCAWHCGAGTGEGAGTAGWPRARGRLPVRALLTVREPGLGAGREGKPGPPPPPSPPPGPAALLLCLPAPGSRGPRTRWPRRPRPTEGAAARTRDCDADRGRRGRAGQVRTPAARLGLLHLRRPSCSRTEGPTPGSRGNDGNKSGLVPGPGAVSQGRWDTQVESPRPATWRAVPLASFTRVLARSLLKPATVCSCCAELLPPAGCGNSNPPEPEFRGFLFVEP